jgi:hypothetical protein
MIAFAQLMVIAFVVLSVVYIVLSLYSRSVRRGKLNAQWDEDGLKGDKEAFVHKGLKDYDGSLRRKLILGVYIVPLVLVAVIIYMNNFY